VSKSHSACRNHSCAYWNYSCECRSYICACQNHTECGNYTLRVEITLCIWKSHSTYINHTMHVEITLFRVEITVVSVEITFLRVKISLRVATHSECVKISLCVWKSHSACINHSRACWNHTLRLEIILCMWTSQYACESHYACEDHTCVIVADFFFAFFGRVITSISTWIHACPCPLSPWSIPAARSFFCSSFFSVQCSPYSHSPWSIVAYRMAHWQNASWTTFILCKWAQVPLWLDVNLDIATKKAISSTVEIV
jgi:hypothetical protein